MIGPRAWMASAGSWDPNASQNFNHLRSITPLSRCDHERQRPTAAFTSQMGLAGEGTSGTPQSFIRSVINRLPPSSRNARGPLAGSGRILMSTTRSRVHTHDAPVDAALHVGIGLQSLKDSCPGAVGRPASMPIMNGLPAPETRRKIPPGNACPQTEKNAVDHCPVVPSARNPSDRPSAPSSTRRRSNDAALRSRHGIDAMMIGMVTLDRRDAERPGHVRPDAGKALRDVDKAARYPSEGEHRAVDERTVTPPASEGAVLFVPSLAASLTAALDQRKPRQEGSRNGGAAAVCAHCSTMCHRSIVGSVAVPENPRNEECGKDDRSQHNESCPQGRVFPDPSVCAFLMGFTDGALGGWCLPWWIQRYSHTRIFLPSHPFRIALRAVVFSLRRAGDSVVALHRRLSRTAGCGR